MLDTDIKAEDLDYTTFAMTLGQLAESDRVAAVVRVQHLLTASRPKQSPSTRKNLDADEASAFRADIAAQVLKELVRSGKVKRLIRQTEE